MVLGQNFHNLVFEASREVSTRTFHSLCAINLLNWVTGHLWVCHECKKKKKKLQFLIIIIIISLTRWLVGPGRDNKDSLNVLTDSRQPDSSELWSRTKCQQHSFKCQLNASICSIARLNYSIAIARLSPRPPPVVAQPEFSVVLSVLVAFECHIPKY